MPLTGPVVWARVGRVVASLRDFMQIVKEVESARAHADGPCDFAAGTPQEMASQQYVDRSSARPSR
jgi:hypothetical protein